MNVCVCKYFKRCPKVNNGLKSRLVVERIRLHFIALFENNKNGKENKLLQKNKNCKFEYIFIQKIYSNSKNTHP